ncbi:hypothetical protein SEMRO_722_G192800.1 [Seminavis robusta]|uniref:Uncharacterized protein n=1 Tax=Seminavis robusta TaxID=568900 RepID=A0A9N8E824_9STRA|nr:hypothetical protein SEMRO_722_G192800.1 [Seminavis robusta]|eukprot:Sro722_g192800.1 n/a (261) ;mRNA; f:4144-5129
MDPPVRTRIVQAYSSIKDDLPVGVNPVVKVPLSIWTHNTKLHINEIEPMDTGGGGTAGGAAGGTTYNQLQQLIAQEGRTRDSSAAALRGWLETWLGAELRKLNGNICRIAVQPPRMATPGQVDANLFRNGLTVERTRRNGQTSLRYRSAVATPADSRPAKLSKYRNIGPAWTEWIDGIDGNKPAKNFTPEEIRACKSTYSRRKSLWDLMAKLVNSGKAPAWVISKIDHHYTGSVLNIAAAIKQDTIMNSLHEDLCIVRAQ